jgi:hypothetical protein
VLAVWIWNGDGTSGNGTGVVWTDVEASDPSSSAAAVGAAAVWSRSGMLVASSGSFAMLQYEVFHSYHHRALPAFGTYSRAAGWGGGEGGGGCMSGHALYT